MKSPQPEKLMATRDVEIFLDMVDIWIDFENLYSPNNKICSRNIKCKSLRKPCRGLFMQVWQILFIFGRYVVNMGKNKFVDFFFSRMTGS